MPGRIRAFLRAGAGAGSLVIVQIQPYGVDGFIARKRTLSQLRAMLETVNLKPAKAFSRGPS